MKQYDEKIQLYFDLKGTPDSSRESYWRRIRAFLSFMQNLNKSIEDMKEEDIQQYILFLKKEKGLSAGTINNYISSIRFFYTYVLEKDWNEKKIPRRPQIFNHYYDYHFVFTCPLLRLTSCYLQNLDSYRF